MKKMILAAITAAVLTITAQPQQLGTAPVEKKVPIYRIHLACPRGQKVWIYQQVGMEPVKGTEDGQGNYFAMRRSLAGLSMTKIGRCDRYSIGETKRSAASIMTQTRQHHLKPSSTPRDTEKEAYDDCSALEVPTGAREQRHRMTDSRALDS
jgi:hypothetical protein